MSKKIVIRKKMLSSIISQFKEYNDHLAEISEKMDMLEKNLSDLGIEVRELAELTRERINSMK